MVGLPKVSRGTDKTVFWPISDYFPPVATTPRASSEGIQTSIATANTTSTASQSHPELLRSKSESGDLETPRIDLSRVLLVTQGIQQIFASFLQMGSMPDAASNAIPQFVTPEISSEADNNTCLIHRLHTFIVLGLILTYWTPEPSSYTFNKTKDLANDSHSGRLVGRQARRIEECGGISRFSLETLGVLKRIHRYPFVDANQTISCHNIHVLLPLVFPFPPVTIPPCREAVSIPRNLSDRDSMCSLLCMIRNLVVAMIGKRKRCDGRIRICDYDSVMLES